MEASINYRNELHSMIRGLIDLKSSRDGKVFTSYQLAKAINMPHSILVKLIHPDPSKRVNNPRIDTLVKIIDFFKSDGFIVTIDDFLFQKNEIDVQSQLITSDQVEKKIQLFSMNYHPNEIGQITVKVNRSHSDLMAFLSEEEIKPFFKAKSIFIIDKLIKPENENLVAVKIENHEYIVIRKLLINGHHKILISLESSEIMTKLIPTTHYSIIGVVVQVNAKT